MSDHKNNTQELITQALDSQTRAIATADLLIRQANEAAGKAEHESIQLFAILVQIAVEGIRNDLDDLAETVKEIEDATVEV